MRNEGLRCVALLLVMGASARAAELSANNIVMSPGGAAGVTVSGAISAESTFGVTLQVELVPRAGAVGTVQFTSAPPIDIAQVGDPWPGAGTFNRFDTDSTGATTLNGSVDDNGTFVPTALTFSGQLTSFPVSASANAYGVWDVLLATSAGDSLWEGAASTTRIAGSVTVQPSVSLTVESRSMPPGTTATLRVFGGISGQSTFGVTILVELTPRAGASGAVTFTTAPPGDISQQGDPWPGVGTFTGFDTDATGSTAQNGSVDDNGTFVSGALTFSGALSGFPVQASAGASGVWDVLLSTSAGVSGWEGVTTALLAGTITVSAAACTADAQCNDGNGCTADSCVLGTCMNINTTNPCNDGDQCTGPDACSGGVCVGPTIGNGGACNDGNLCTTGDVCNGGVCAGTPVNCSGLNTTCAVGVCNAGTGACQPSPINQGGACNDGDVCTINDACVSGACVGTPIPNGGACNDGALCTINDQCNGGICAGTPVDCSGLDGPCTQGVCNPANGNCVANPINQGVSCDDGNSCTSGDVCNAGQCAGSTLPNNTPCDDVDQCTLNDVCTSGVCDGVPVDCSGQSSACTLGVCNPTTGQCSAQPVNEGNTCSDGSNCTTNDICVSGACTGTIVDCSAFSGPCSLGSCNASTGQCDIIPIGNGSSCSDGNLCTTGDVCSNGTCSGAPTSCTSLNGPCTQGACNPANGNCVANPINQGASCNDNDRCTNGDACNNGVCTGVPLDCSTLTDTCNIGSCHAPSGTCRKTPANEGGACNDGLPCTSGDICTNGSCAGTLTGAPSVDLIWSPSSAQVSVGQVFQVDLLAASGTCVNQPFASIEVILNWDPAVLELTAFTQPVGHESSFPDDSDLDGLNAPFTDLPENDGDGLYLAFAGFQQGKIATPAGTLLSRLSFTALDGAANTAISIPDSTGLFTQTRVLGAGPQAGQDITGTTDNLTLQLTECLAGADCSDGNVCTTDTCTVDRLCVYSFNTLSCNDDVFCTATDVCNGGVCVGSGNRCPGPGQFCNETLGACVQCLENSHCNDNNPCTNNVCNPVGQCSFPNNTLPCNDGLFCTATDACSGGSCVGSGAACSVGQICEENNDRCVQCQTAAQCNDSNVCTNDTCNTTTGQCVHTNNSLSCNDGLFCTVTDTCTGGSCVGSGVRCPGQLCNEGTDACVNCLGNGNCPSDGNVCTNEQCIGGNCFNVNNTLSCNDNLFCTQTDVCSNGACGGSGNPCTGGQLCDEPRDRCAQCITNADCNDNIACTSDVCDLNAGTCVRTPNNNVCSDGLFCNGSETCVVGTGCVPGTQPCDSAPLCNEATDTCTCAPPTVVAESPRGFSVIPSPGVIPVAIRVVGSSTDSRVACVGQWVQANGQLGNSLVFRTPTQWGTVHVGDSEIIPSATFVVHSDCRVQPTNPANPSTTRTVSTWQWGDVDNNTQINFVDISFIVDGFQGEPTAATLYAMDLHDCIPNRIINFSDISWGVDAFRARPYPCSQPCP